MSSSLSKREINRQRWYERIEDWKQSGLTQKGFCERHHLGLASFQRWRRIFMREGQTGELCSVSFLPVHVTAPKACSLTLRINDTLCIEVPAGFDPVTLKQVVQVLQTS
jgi:hypothetical protein